MSTPDGLAFGDAIPEADVADQQTPVDPGDEDTWHDAAEISAERTWEANEADLVDQAIAVPLPDDDLPFE